MTVSQIAKKVEEFTNCDVKNIGRKVSSEKTIAKHIFFRYGYLNCISGTLLGEYTGDKSRYTAWNGRRAHTEKCKKNNWIRIQWEEFKIFAKNEEK